MEQCKCENISSIKGFGVAEYKGEETKDESESIIICGTVGQ